MSAEENKAVVRRFFDELNRGNVSALDDLLNDQYTGHFTGVPVPMNRQGLKQFVDLSAGPFPDFSHQIEDLLAEDDKVVARVTYSGTHRREFMGLPATGKQVCRVSRQQFVETSRLRHAIMLHSSVCAPRSSVQGEHRCTGSMTPTPVRPRRR